MAIKQQREIWLILFYPARRNVSAKNYPAKKCLCEEMGPRRIPARRELSRTLPRGNISRGVFVFAPCTPYDFAHDTIARVAFKSRWRNERHYVGFSAQPPDAQKRDATGTRLCYRPLKCRMRSTKTIAPTFENVRCVSFILTEGIDSVRSQSIVSPGEVYSRHLCHLVLDCAFLPLQRLATQKAHFVNRCGRHFQETAACLE